VISYDPEGDVLLIDLTDGAVNADTEGVEIDREHGIWALYDDKGMLLGFEITSASKIVAAGALVPLAGAAA